MTFLILITEDTCGWVVKEWQVRGIAEVRRQLLGSPYLTVRICILVVAQGLFRCQAHDTYQLNAARVVLAAFELDFKRSGCVRPVSKDFDTTCYGLPRSRDHACMYVSMNVTLSGTGGMVLQQVAALHTMTGCTIYVPSNLHRFASFVFKFRSVGEFLYLYLCVSKLCNWPHIDRDV